MLEVKCQFLLVKRSEIVSFSTVERLAPWVHRTTKLDKQGE